MHSMQQWDSVAVCLFPKSLAMAAPQAKVESLPYYINLLVIKKLCSLHIFDKLLTHAYGMESQLALQGGGLWPKVNIGSND